MAGMPGIQPEIAKEHQKVLITVKHIKIIKILQITKTTQTTKI